MHSKAEQESNYLRKLRRCGQWVVLVCVLRATTKKGRQLFGGRKVHLQTKSWLRLLPYDVYLSDSVFRHSRPILKHF